MHNTTNITVEPSVLPDIVFGAFVGGTASLVFDTLTLILYLAVGRRRQHPAGA